MSYIYNAFRNRIIEDLKITLYNNYIDSFRTFYIYIIFFYLISQYFIAIIVTGNRYCDTAPH